VIGSWTGGPATLRSDIDVLARVRRALLWTLVVGVIGTGVELLLLGHFEGLYQQIPLFVLAAGLLVVIAHVARPSAASVRALQVTMAACVLAGGLGVVLHYSGNLEFEREMYPTMSGAELVEKVVTGATPVLAPGSMTLLGVIGLLHAYRHPATSVLQEGEKS